MSLVVAHIAYSRCEAQTVAGSLRAAGIFVIQFDYNTISMMPHASVAFGGFRIMVFESEISDALLLVSEFTKQPSSLESESDAFKRQKIKGIFGVYLQLWWGIWFPWWIKSRQWK